VGSPAELGARARRLEREEDRIYRVMTWHAFDEGECFVSQKRIACLTGLSRFAVNRGCHRMRAKGRIDWTQQRNDGSRWRHNVYELLDPYVVSDLAHRRITREAHERNLHTNKRSRGLLGFGRPGGHARCRCRFCRRDRTSIRRLPGPILPPESEFERRMAAIEATFRALWRRSE
jgi:hypothetical protein